MAAVKRLNNYLRTYRKHSGLSQSEVAFLVKVNDKAAMSRYETGGRSPSLRTALAYQALYGTPVAELFAGLNDSVAKETRSRMVKLHMDLQAKVGAERSQSRLMQKIQWVSHHLLSMPNFKLVRA